jgi:hypothetical protein
MEAKPNSSWREELDRAFDLIGLVTTYAEDGAFFTAADRLDDAAKLFRSAAEQRRAAFEKLGGRS